MTDNNENSSNNNNRLKYADFTTIDWIHDLQKDRVRVKSLRHQKNFWLYVYDASQGWIIVTLVGLLAGLIAAFITISSEWLNDLKVGHCKTTWYLSKKFCCFEEPHCSDWVEYEGFSGFLIYFIFAVLFSSLSAFLVKFYAPYAAGSGIPEVKTILSGFVIHKFLGFATLIIKIVGLALSVASGLSLGKEGPYVHLTCCLGNIIPRLFPKYANNEARKREILSASAAAGVSVAFGAPIGGILFSLEEVSYYFPLKTMWRAFFCAMTAAVFLQVMNPLRTNQLVLFEVRYAHVWKHFEILIYAFIGVLGGLYGSAFNVANIWVNKQRKNGYMKNWRVVEVMSVAAITAIISYAHPYTRMNTSELVSVLLHDCDDEYPEFCDSSKFNYVIGFVFFTVCIKILTTVFTFGLKVPAGIFIPSMAIGACVGRIVGSLVQLFYESHPHWSIFEDCKNGCVSPGTYAMVGAAAFLGGVTRMTVSLVVIVFELTGALTYVLPIMLAVLLAKWTGDYFHKGSIYEGLIELNGYPFFDDHYDISVYTTIEHCMTSHDQINVITTNEDVESIQQLLTDTTFNGYPVVSDRSEMILLGFVGRREIDFSLNTARKAKILSETTKCLFCRNVSDSIPETPVNFFSSPAELPMQRVDDDAIDFRKYVDNNPVTIPPCMTIDKVLELFKKLGLRYALIVERGRLTGIVTKKDLLNFLHHCN